MRYIVRGNHMLTRYDGCTHLLVCPS